MQCGKFARGAPVGLDPLARLSRDQRRSHHRTLVPKPGKLSLNAIAARAGFIAEPKFAVSAGQLRDQRFHRRRRIGDLPVLSHLSPDARVGQGNHYRILVYVEPDIRGPSSP